ncbi:hypothetical protein [Streptomyces sp. ISL-11]|uniref:hypothetical protein n=1 Tax=Streptomyces sp. ISL-11 TaxID=2819174 RepID=UPI001BEA1E04|nr:hypothetical protein [Streptomyces sp. ISL-11]MBT2382806.1 hypothetical protein [Streptomyces sp. ISL-11]
MKTYRLSDTLGAATRLCAGAPTSWPAATAAAAASSEDRRAKAEAAVAARVIQNLMYTQR